jgi:hypothetical protein
MAISTLFFIFIAAFVVAVICALFNFFAMSKSMFNSVKSMDIEEGFGKMQSGMGLHILFGGLASLAGLGSLITGIIWLVQTFKGA